MLFTITKKIVLTEEESDAFHEVESILHEIANFLEDDAAEELVLNLEQYSNSAELTNYEAYKV